MLNSNVCPAPQCEQSDPTQENTCTSEQKSVSQVRQQSQFSSRMRSDSIQCVLFQLGELRGDIDGLKREYQILGDLLTRRAGLVPFQVGFYAE
jgi:hypothetical protein